MQKMEIDAKNMRVLLLDNSPFFQFKKPETFHEKQYFYFEAQRFCYLHECAKEIPTHELMNILIKTSVSYWIESENLFYHPVDKKFIGKFVTTKTCNKLRFIEILNLNSKNWCGMP